MWSGLATSAVMLMLVRIPAKRLSIEDGLLIVVPVGVIQDAKFKRREALADLAKAATKKQ